MKKAGGAGRMQLGSEDEDGGSEDDEDEDEDEDASGEGDEGAWLGGGLA